MLPEAIILPVLIFSQVYTNMVRAYATDISISYHKLLNPSLIALGLERSPNFCEAMILVVLSHANVLLIFPITGDLCYLLGRWFI